MRLNILGNWLWAAGLATALTACGGSSGGANGQGSDSTDDSGATPGTDDGRTSAVLLLGLNEGSSFSAGMVQTDLTTMDFGEEATLLVNVVNSSDNNNIYTDSTTVTFSSECSSKGLASFANDGVIKTSSGVASVKYSDLGCSISGDVTDKITARITAIDSESVSGSASATTKILVKAPVIALTPNKVNLNAGELTNLNFKITKSTGDELSLPSPLTIGFTSECVTGNKATFSEGGLVITETGSINTKFQDNGCGVIGGKTEAVKATVKFLGSESISNGPSISTNLNIGPPIADEVIFESATPQNLDINRLGASNYSLVQFKVLSDADIPVENHEVRATISDQNGGATLEADTVNTDSNGIATFKLVSGKTKAYVELSVETNIYSADGSTVTGTLQQKSLPIEIDKGLPTYDSFTLSTSAFNPQSADLQGTTVSITARLNDLSGNPVKNGTKISFETDKTGTIDSFCTTSNGGCTATWRSNPNDASRNDDFITIIAYTDGELIKNDPNRNGFWDLNEPFSHVGEVIMDANDNGDFDLNTDSYFDANGNGAYDDETSFTDVYRGVSCSDEAAAANTGDGVAKHCEDTARIWKAIRLVNSSGDGINIRIWEGSAEVASDGVIAISDEQASLRIVITDEFGRTPPAGTTIALETENGSIVAGDDIKSVPNTMGIFTRDASGLYETSGFEFTAVLRKDDEPSVGPFTIKVTTVDGVSYSRSQSLSDEDDAVSTTVDLELGNGSGNPGFQKGVITSTKSTLQPGESAELTVSVVNSSDANTLYTGSTSQVTFTSTCAIAGKAAFSPATVSGKTGILKTTYIDKGCAEQSDDVSMFSDRVVATLSNDNSATAMVDLNVQPTQVGSLEYQSATPTKIALQGFGNASLPTVSEVTFKLEDTLGNPIIDRPVRFELDQSAGGASLIATQASTDINGIATARLKSGRAPASVRVRAIADKVLADGSLDGEIRVLSEDISMSNSLPTQDGFILEANVLNPHAYDVNGTEVKFKATLKGRDNVAVDDGTVVKFLTDGNGTFVQDQCETENGSCEVTWRSGRSDGYDAADQTITVMARAVGEAGFVDSNGNGVWDLAETFNPVAEAYLDANDNGTFDVGIDRMADYNGDGVVNPASDFTAYRGIACSEDAIAAGAGHCDNLVEVWKSIQLINSHGGPATVSLWQGSTQVPIGGTIAIDTPAALSVLIQDSNGNTPPAGTAIEVEVDNGSIVTGGSISVVPSLDPSGATDGYRFDLVLRGDDEPSIGDLRIKVTSKTGAITEHIFTLDDDDDAVSSTVALKLGNGSGAGFQNGVISSNKATLNAGDQAELTLTIVNGSDSDALYTEATSQVTFTSTCASAGKAEFSPAIVSGNTGTLKTKYIDKGCAEQSDDVSAFSDTVVATLSNDNTATAMVSFNVQPTQVGSLEYQSATPTKIALQGFGNASLPTVSEVTFKLEDTLGNPIIDRPVRFELDQSAGGASLISAQANTDINGIATARLKSGRAPASVRVRAITDKVLVDGSLDGEIRVLSADVSMSNSLPTQNGFKLEANVLNPHAYDVNGTEVEFKATLSGRDNVAVDDGTVVKFLTDGNGFFVKDQCETDGGSCEVIWRSGRSDSYTGDEKITVMARAVGEAGFVDTNGNGVWDLTETFNPVAEAYLDANDNGIFDVGIDRMADYNGDGVVNPASDFTAYRGIACSEDAIAAGAGHCDNLVEVWKSIQLINSHGGPATVSLWQGSAQVPIGGTIAIDTPATLSVLIQDENGNTPPAGTAIAIEADNGDIVTGGNVKVVPSLGASGATDGYRFSLVLRGDVEPSKGDLRIRVTSKTGIITEQVYTLDDDDDAVSSTVALKLGNGSGAGFQNGVITSNKATLNAGDEAELTLTVVNGSESDALYTDAVSQVEFTSTCASAGKAEFSPAIVSGNTGTLKTTYIDKGCAEQSDDVSAFSDTVVATLTNDNTVNAMVSFNVQPAKVGALEYKSASPTKLALIGFGNESLPTVSEVTFKVTDEHGEPIIDRPVKFALEGSSGGATIIFAEANSDFNGIATARLKSGTTPANIRVKATVDQVNDSGVVIGSESAFSEVIAINTRLPTQQGFKLEATILNPQAYDANGTEVEIKAILKDRNNLSVDDDTVVSFATDDNGYFDEDTCATEDGVCKVIWRSSRSYGYDDDFIISILARVEGEIDFTDANGNGVWDLGEAYSDMSEAYLDVNDNGTFDTGVDQAFDYNEDGTLANPASDFTSYRGIACSEAAFAAGHCAELAEVWQTISLLNSSGGTAKITLYSEGNIVTPGSEIEITGTKTFTVHVRDAKDNLPPMDTEINVNVQNGSLVAGSAQQTITSQFRQPNQPYSFDISIKADKSPSVDDLIIEVVNADGTVTRQVYEINDGLDDSPVETADLAIGSIVSSVFENEVATVTIGDGATLSSGGSTTVKVDVVDRNDGDNKYTNFTNVYFTSPCVQQGLAEFSPNIVLASGTARSTYKDKGCAEDSVVEEEIEVKLVELDNQGNVDLVVAEAKANIKVAPAQVGAIAFMSASPESISLKGLGSNAVMPEISQVSFRVLDKNNEPMPGRDVRFSLSNDLAGVELTRFTAATDVDGIASVQVRSGHTHGNVIVKAEMDMLDELGNKIDVATVHSTPISITTGLPVQSSFTLAVDKNSAWGWDAANNIVKVTARLADQYGNSVPDDTRVAFTAEGGSTILGSCSTDKGSCSVDWVTQDYRPLDGIVTIVARVEGVADFQDDNSNGIYDIGEAFEYYGESYLDADDSGTFNKDADYLPDLDIDDDGVDEFNWLRNDANLDHENKNFKEEFYDHNGDETYTSRADKAPVYQGVTCSEDARAIGHCAEVVQLSKSVRIVMSHGSNAHIEGPFAYDSETDTLDLSQTLSCVDVRTSFKSVGWRVADSVERRNKLPSGTLVFMSTDEGKVESESGTGTVPDIVNIAYPHGTPSGTPEQKAEYRDQYLFDRGHRVIAQVGPPQDISTEFGQAILNVTTLSGVKFSSPLQLGLSTGSIRLTEGIQPQFTVDVTGGTKTLTVEVSEACGFALEEGTEITVTTGNGTISNPVAETAHVSAAMESGGVKVTLSGREFEGEPNRFSFDISPDADSNRLTDTLVISISTGQYARYTVED